MAECRSCRYFQPPYSIQDVDSMPLVVGNCVRRAPQVQAQHAGSPLSVRTAQWPRVFAREWCGDYEVRIPARDGNGPSA